MAGPHAGNRNRPAYSGQSRFRFPRQIIELFAPRKPVEFKPTPKRRKLPPMTGIAAYVSKFGQLPPVSAKPSDSKPSDSKPSDSKPSDSKPSDSKPSDSKHSDSKPSDSKVSDTKVSDTKRSDPLVPNSKPPDASASPAPSSNSAPVAISASKSEPAVITPPSPSTAEPAAAFETPAMSRKRKRAAALERVRSIVEARTAEWDPFGKDGSRKTLDAYNTLFVSGFARDTLPARLQSEFESYGPVIDVIIPRDRGGVPRGYAFVEFEREADLKVAYKEARGRKIDGRRILVDVERGRTVKNWRPNRLDGPNNSCKH